MTEIKDPNPLRDESVDTKIAENFLGWKPPLTLHAAVKMCDQMTFSEGHFRDQELERLTKFWLAHDTQKPLPNFRTNTKAMFRLIRQFHILGLFVEIEPVGNDYVATVFAEPSLEKIVASGRSPSRIEAVYFATVDYLNFSFKQRLKKA